MVPLAPLLPNNVRMRTHPINDSSRGSGAAAFMIGIDSISPIGPIKLLVSDHRSRLSVMTARIISPKLRVSALVFPAISNARNSGPLLC